MISKTSPNFFIKGFTIIELLIVIAIISIISAIGIVGFGNYSKSQALQSAANDVATALNTAKSRAQSQVKAPCVDSSTLQGHKFKVLTESTYRLYARCDNFDNEYPKPPPLTGSIKFRADSINDEVYFLILTGKVDSAEDVNLFLTGPSGQKTIIISNSGSINIQDD